jgi:chemotaxis protein methyltransferase CheR
MEFRAASLGLAGSVTTILRDLIHERLGIFYEPPQFEQVADRLAPLVVERGLGSFLDYYYVLKYSDDPREWGRIMDVLSVQETYFWREIDQIRALVEHVVPELVARSAGVPIRIWSAPCATGEEPLTIAMMLNEHGWFERAPFDIIGSDGSPAAIAKARSGVYGKRSFRNLPETLRDRYFSPMADGSWMADVALQSRVRYDVVNLMHTDLVAAHARAPVIFCRNVFIYFSDRSIGRAVDTFAASMLDPGYLCVGASESLLRLATRFELREIGGAFMYARTEEAQVQPALVASTRKGTKWNV